MMGFTSSYDVNDRKESECITQRDIDAIRAEIKIGDRIKYKSGTSYTYLPEGSKTSDFVTGRVIAKYSNYFEIETPLGFRESIRWVDLIIWRRGKNEDNFAEQGG